MPIYRVLKPLSKGFDKVIPKGTVLNINWLDADGLARLEGVGAIARVAMPPLEKLPAWSLRAKRLEKAGITGGEQFLEMDDKELAERLQADPRTIAKWKEELRTIWLVIPGLEDKRR